MHRYGNLSFFQPGHNPFHCTRSNHQQIFTEAHGEASDIGDVAYCTFLDHGNFGGRFKANLLLLPKSLASEDAYPHSGMLELYLYLARASSRFGYTLAYMDSWLPKSFVNIVRPIRGYGWALSSLRILH